VAQGEGERFTHLVLPKTPSRRPFWLVWVGDVALGHLILPGSFWSSLTVVTLRHGQRYGGVAVVDGWAIGAGVGDDGG
jgi:hypothetical protein